MNRLALAVSALLLAGCYSATRMARITPLKDQSDARQKIAVAGFKNATGQQSMDASAAGLGAMLITDLQAGGRYRIIERDRLDTVMSELKLNLGGLINPETAQQVGRQVGVEAFVFGEIDSVSVRKSKHTIGIMYTDAQRTEVTVSARIVSVETGEILRTANTSTYVKERRWVAFGFARIGSTSAEQTAIQEALRRAVNHLAVQLSAR